MLDCEHSSRLVLRCVENMRFDKLYTVEPLKHCLSPPHPQLCLNPTDRALQPAAVPAHILLSLLHDRECVLWCLQVSVPPAHAHAN